MMALNAGGLCLGVTKLRVAKEAWNSVTWSIVVHGENLGLLSTKLAIMYPKSTIVSVKDDTTDTESHLHLLELLGIHVTYYAINV